MNNNTKLNIIIITIISPSIMAYRRTAEESARIRYLKSFPFPFPRNRMSELNGLRLGDVIIVECGGDINVYILSEDIINGRLHTDVINGTIQHTIVNKIENPDEFYAGLFKVLRDNNVTIKLQKEE